MKIISNYMAFLLLNLTSIPMIHASILNKGRCSVALLHHHPLTLKLVKLTRTIVTIFVLAHGVPHRLITGNVTLSNNA